MADPITGAIAWAGAEMGSAALIMYATEIASVVTFTAAVVGSSAYARQQQRKARAAYNAGLKDREVTFRSGVSPRRVIYGRDRVGGTLAYVQSTGDKGEYLHLVIALAAHECDAIEEVWFGDVKLPDPDGSGFITSGDFAKHSADARHSTVTTSAGGVATLPAAASRVLSITTPFVGSGIDATGGDLITGWAHTAGAATITGLPASASVVVDYEVDVAEALVRVKKHLGAPGQVADADLVAESGGKWTSAHKGSGLCYLYLRLKFDPDVFASFDPSSITAVVRGRRVYDYRTSTTAWTENAALIAADWLRDQTVGLRASAAELPSAEVIAEANICDEAVTIGTGGATQPRYTFNGSLTTDQSPIDVLEDLLSGMAGTCIWIQGRWLMRAGAYRTPTVTLTADDLAGSSITVQPRTSRADLINAVRATHRDPTQAWAEVQAPLVANSTYTAQDGGTQIARSIAMPGAMDSIRAQRLAKIELERARQAVSVRLTTSLRGYNLAPTDTVTLQLPRYGWGSGKVFEVRERSLNTDGSLTYLLRETAASVWAWALGEATVLDPAPDTELPSPYARLAAPASLAATSGTARLADGSVVARVRLSWAQHPDAFVTRGGRIDVRWRRSGSDQWQDVAPVDGAETGAYLTGVPEGNVIVAQARAVNAAGRASDWATVAHLVDTVTAIDWQLISGSGRPADGATTDLALVGRDVAVVGNTATKSTASTGWDADCYSLDSYTGGAYASAVAPDATLARMFGLNSDPLTDRSYTSIDYAMYLNNGGVLEAYESGSLAQALGSYAAGDVLAVVYDGAAVRYMRNGSVLRTVAAAAGLRLYFDSAFYNVAAALRGIRFGPLSPVTGINTGQLVDQAVTALTFDSYDFGALNVSGMAGAQLMRTYTITPAAACKLELAVEINAARVQGDSGYSLYYTIAVGSGSDTLLHFISSASLDAAYRLFTFRKVIDAAAGVTLTIKLKAEVYSGAPTPMVLYASSFTAIEFKK